MKSIGVSSSKPTVCQERCPRVLFSGAHCSRCLAVCPFGSIRFAYPTLTIDDTCSGCGFCVALCPNEVFAFQGDNPVSVDEGERPSILYCSGLLAAGPMPAGLLPPSIVPCLGSVPASFILDHALRKEKPLEVITGTCRECSLKAGEGSYRLRGAEITSLFDYLHIGFPPVSVSAASSVERQQASEVYEAFQISLGQKQTLSRRDFFKHLRRTVAPQRPQPVMNLIRPGGEGSESRRPSEFSRLRVEVFQRYAGRLAEQKETVRGFIEVSVDEACSGCGACANLCPTGALTIDDDLKSARLLWTPAHCSDCNLCFDVCARKALHREPCLNAGKIADETTLAIKEFYRYLCPECGKSSFSSGPASLCSDCTKTGDFMNAVSAMIYGQERVAGR
jgi:NAD-dependent dihydropyrimidine dehydrogenase PreA subunit